ncbi:MAG TPA: NADH:ubiquinone reductase (Na(+)-transporting) subunit C [Saprospiraceae bacterium]|nr:NADH:ubiquinone reductase (Na(+)-transporting) subunit C [Saprospiraceae bacterium]HNT20285.1 NADH:ubiquinone reductase (Na(+)-transporting) subunit C [Saprospiraceae bacterium]
MFNNRYILIYTLVMALVVSVALAFVVNGLKPLHDINEAVFKKKDILSAIRDQIGADPLKMKDEELIRLFEEKMDKVVLDANGKVVTGLDAETIDLAAEEKKPSNERKYPLFIYKGDKGNIYLMSVRGNGLWDKIWGYIALEGDFNTIAGASFGHVAETPGLGAEIKDNANFPNAFHGKKIYENGNYVSVQVVKGGIKVPDHQVDAISGATITSNGVSEMLNRGMVAYLPYFESLKKK